MRKEQFFITYEQKALAYHVIYKQLTSSFIHCAFLCVNNPSCKSMNFNSVVGGKKKVNANAIGDATAKEFPVHLKRSLSSTYSVANDLG